MTGPEPLVQLLLTPTEARELYDYLEGDDCPNYWETPLNPAHRELRKTMGEW